MGLIFIAGIGLIVTSYFPFWPVMHFANMIDVIGFTMRLSGYLVIASVMAVIAISIPCFQSDAK